MPNREIDKLKKEQGLPLNYNELEEMPAAKNNGFVKYVNSVFHQTQKHALSRSHKSISKIFNLKNIRNERT